MAGDTTEINEPTDQFLSPAEIRDQPTEGLVSGTVGDRCVSCGSPLSSDQRYCVVCGERRGAPRFSLPAPATATSEAAPRPPKEPRRPRVGAGTTLVAGVATLLLALLVGVLIGHNTAGNGSKTIEAGPTKVIKVNAGAPAAATASTPAAATSASGRASGKHTGSNTKTKATAKSTKTSTKIPAKTAKQLSSAAKKVTGGAGGAAPTTTVGGSCAAGSAGCNKKTHKFTGSFFGG